MRLKILILVIVSVLTFINTLWNDFIWDDIPFIKEDTNIKSLDNIFTFFKPDYWTKDFKGTSGRFRPLRSILFTIEYHLWSLKTTFYHLVNVILHTIVVVLVYLFLRRWITSGDDKMPFLTALVFAVIPVHAESVAWIKNCTDLLCMIFYILSFNFLLKTFYTNPSRGANNFFLSSIYYLLSITFFIIAILAKEMAVTLPVIVFIYLLLYREKKIWKNLVKLTGHLVILGFVFIYKVFVLEPEAPLTLEPSFVVKTLGEYFQILLFPFSLCAERNVSKITSFFDPTFLFGLFVIFISAVILIYKKELRFYYLFLLVTILPVLNIVYLTGRPLAEQRLYIPSLGFCMLTGYGFAQNWGKGVTKKLFMMLIAGYTIISFGRNFDWKDNVTFWSKTLTQAPSPRAYANLGEAYMKIEENELALRSLSEAIRMDPNCIEALSNLGIVYTKFGNYEKARFYFERCMELSPKDANQYVNLGVINLDNKELNKAIEIFKKGLIVNNKHPLLHYNLGNAYKKLGLLDKAIQEYKIAMVLNPDLKPAKINLESVLKQKGNKKRD